MATPVTIVKYRLRAGSAIPKSLGTTCSTSAPASYILQSFGVEASSSDSWDSLIGLYGSEVMQGLQNYEDTEEFRARAYVRITYTGTNTRDTDGTQIFRGQEEHSFSWLEESDASLNWVS